MKYVSFQTARHETAVTSRLYKFEWYAEKIAEEPLISEVVCFYDEA
jgi:hypothetical protein